MSDLPRDVGIELWHIIKHISHRRSTTRIPLTQVTIKIYSRTKLVQIGSIKFNAQSTYNDIYIYKLTPKLIKHRSEIPNVSYLPFAKIAGERMRFVEHPLHVFYGRDVPI